MHPLKPILSMFFLWGLSTSASAIEPFATYDAFSGDRINPDRWIALGTDPFTLDVVRAVGSGVLWLGNRSYGDRSVTGGRVRHDVRLQFANSNAIHSIAGLFQVTALDLVGCSAPSGTSTQVEVRIDGYFFNDGSSSGAGDATGDIWIQLRLDRSTSSGLPAGRMRVTSNVFHCQDSRCDTGPDLFFDATSLGTVGIGEPVLLAVLWDADNDRFIFARNGFPALVYSYTNDVATDANPPGSLSGKRLTNRARIESCVPDPCAHGLHERRGRSRVGQPVGGAVTATLDA